MEFGKDLVRGSIVPVVLSLLRDRPMYGYEIVKLVNARSGGRLEWKEGTLYPALHKLEADGLLRSHWADAADDNNDSDEQRGGGGGGDPPGVGRKRTAKAAGGGGRQRKYYAVTGKGRTELARRSEEWREFTTAVNAVLLGGQL
jgi:PadR family transcriptional regulator PadR